MSRPVITLTTDFGQADGYVGTMKGVILGLCPDATLVDISHDVRPQAISQAAYLLSTVVPYFPPGAVHLAVVDPGVGGDRRPIAVGCGRAVYVAPDNGLLTMALDLDPPRLAVQIQPVGPLSATFHGRDLFAPAAARLACGVDLDEMGLPIPLSSLVTLPGLQPQRQDDGSWLGQVLHIDRFGNLITNLQPSDAGCQSIIRVGAVRLAGLRRTFGDVAPGEILAYVGSSGYLEIARRDGNAADRLGVAVGDAVQVESWP
jgi:hypothetical protein